MLTTLRLICPLFHFLIDNYSVEQPNWPGSGDRWHQEDSINEGEKRNDATVKMVLSVSFWKHLQRRVAYLVWDYEERPLGDNIKEIQQSAFSFVGLTNFIRLYFITKWNYLMNYSARKTKHVFDDRTLCMEDFNLLWEAVSKLRNETAPKALWTQVLTALDKSTIRKIPKR